MKEPRVLLIFLILLLSFAFTACGQIPEAGESAPVAGMPLSEPTSTLPPMPTTLPPLTPIPTTLPPLTSTPAQPTRAPEQANLTVFTELTSGGITEVVFDPMNPEIIYTGSEKGIFKSTDNGSSWRFISADLRSPRWILVDPVNPQVLYACRMSLSGEDTGLSAPGIYKSTDGGITWHVKGEGTGGQSIYSIALDPNSPHLLYAGSRKGLVFKSTDAGETWSVAGEPPAVEGFPPTTVGELFVHPHTGDVYAVEDHFGAFKSADGGQTWATIHRNSGYLTLDAETDTLYLANWKLWKSTDGGESWQDISGDLPVSPGTGTRLISWFRVISNPPVLYVGRAYTQIYRSTDGGVTWTRLDDWEIRFTPVALQAASPPVIYGSASIYLGRFVDTSLP